MLTLNKLSSPCSHNFNTVNVEIGHKKNLNSYYGKLFCFQGSNDTIFNKNKIYHYSTKQILKNQNGTQVRFYHSYFETIKRQEENGKKIKKFLILAIALIGAAYIYHKISPKNDEIPFPNTDVSEDITANKWELAQRLAGHSNLPEEVLKAIFTGAMDQLEVMSNTKFETSMRDRVWNKVSEEKLKILKETFILEFCKQILRGFDEDQTKEMLGEHINIKKHIENTAHLQLAYQLNQSLITDAVIEKGHSITKEWIPEIVEAVKKEGIKLY
jgi:hypothetical protein